MRLDLATICTFGVPKLRASVLVTVSLLVCDPLLAFAQSTSGGQGDITLNAQTVSLSDLPTAAFNRPPADTQIGTWLASQPALILDGGTLVIGQPGSAPDVTLRLKRIELRNGAKIITNGSQLEIDALQIVSERGQILSFTTPDMQTAPAVTGITGRAGNSAGRVLLDGGLVGNGVLTVNLFGQNGQPGGVGRPGPAGAPGAPGDHAADHLFDCAHGGGAGGRGEPGRDGEQGARGGRGGNGGTLVLKGRLAVQVDQVGFTALEGTGGDGGPGGPGGAGGPGGSGGGGSTYCSGGPAGPAGPSGNYGQRGPNGDPGTRGQLIATVG